MSIENDLSQMDIPLATLHKLLHRCLMCKVLFDSLHQIQYWLECLLYDHQQLTLELQRLCMVYLYHQCNFLEGHFFLMDVLFL